MATESGSRPAAFVHDRSGGCVLTVRVVPRARQSGITGERDGSVVVRVTAPPQGGAANAAVVDVLAKMLDVPRRAVTVVRGSRERDKLIGIDGVGAGTVASRIQAHLQHATPSRGR